MVSKIYNFLKNLWIRRSSDSLLNYYRSKGCKIGQGTIAKYPKTLDIDFTRPSLIEIGDNVLLHKNLSIISHDFASRVFVNLYHDFVPSHRKVIIGDNVWFGQNCTLLKGVTIGDNCIIGYGSVVTKSIPPGSVAVGVPAKVVSSVEDFYQKRKSYYLEEVVEYAISIMDQLNREPTIEDFFDDYVCFVDKRNIHEYSAIPFHRVFNSTKRELWLEHHQAEFLGFDEFMNYVKKKRNNGK
ncbi:acyltransferase [Sphingobacterium sp. MYb382]|uniref:acyltransferase n=1 Tax=Sphingobacterium sp. MYb382 TaxID=2745278 RepID=UPI0030AD9B87